MKSEFKCQIESCGAMVKAQIRHDRKTDGPCVICDHCKAKYVAVQDIGFFGGANELVFKLHKGGGGGTGDGGG